MQNRISSPRRIVAGVVIVLLLLAVVWTVMATRACAVEIDGQTVAVVKDRATAEAVIEALTQEQENQVGNEVTLVKDATLKTLWDRQPEMVSEEQLRRIMTRELAFETSGVGIEVDGVLTVILKDEASAEQTLSKLRETHRVGPEYETAFREEIDLVTVEARTTQVLSVDQALAQVGAVTPESSVAGRALRISGQPVITVIATAEMTFREEIPFTRLERENWDLPYGRTRVVQQGEKGAKDVTYRLVAANGVEIERDVLNEAIITEARRHIVERGAHVVVGSVRILIPNGPISSPFGWRWGRLHKGIDLALSQGTPVRAAQSGTVVRAGWNGGYGRMVEISHGSGVSTLYAHLSAIGVQVGDRVTIGKTIGRVGSTGASTGPHLHFEIRVNGTAVNPLP